MRLLKFKRSPKFPLLNVLFVKLLKITQYDRNLVTKTYITAENKKFLLFKILYFKQLTAPF